MAKFKFEIAILYGVFNPYLIFTKPLNGVCRLIKKIRTYQKWLKSLWRVAYLVSDAPEPKIDPKMSVMFRRQRFFVKVSIGVKSGLAHLVGILVSTTNRDMKICSRLTHVRYEVAFSSPNIIRKENNRPCQK